MAETVGGWILAAGIGLLALGLTALLLVVFYDRKTRRKFRRAFTRRRQR
jgi:hypothetical protein